MTEDKGMTFLAAEEADDAKELIGRLFDVARPEAVYGEPEAVGDYMIITASEATVSMGFGFGFGTGEMESEAAAVDRPEPSAETGSGGGGGGGGFAASRAVAVVSVGPNGVVVEPVVDVTKIMLAFFTMFGSFLLMLGKMQKKMRD